MQKNLNYYIGSVCEVYSTDNDLLALGRIRNVRTEPCLTIEIASSDGGEMPKLPLGNQIKISIINTKHGFLGLFGRVYIIHDDFWRVDEIRCLGEHERRGFFRVKNHSPARVVPEDDDSVVYQGIVTNVSLSGLLIFLEADKCLFKVDTKLNISGFAIGPNPERFSVNCRVRRVEKHPKAGRLYGCQYEDMDQKTADRICQALFAQQRIEIQRRRGIS